jgi:sugar/nucleoside kinase (ribokinase family)
VSAGRKADTVEEAEQAARQLQEKGVGTVLVKRGAQGSLLVPPEGPSIVQPAEPVAQVGDYLGDVEPMHVHVL